MHYQWLAQGTAVVPGAVPWPVRFLAKFVLEILPAALASLIGGILFAHYQFGQPASPRPAREAAGPATAEMMRLIRDEHSLVHDFLTAQQSVEKARLAASAAEAARCHRGQDGRGRLPPLSGQRRQDRGASQQDRCGRCGAGSGSDADHRSIAERATASACAGS